MPVVGATMGILRNGVRTAVATMLSIYAVIHSLQLHFLCCWTLMLLKGLHINVIYMYSWFTVCAEVLAQHADDAFF